MESVITALPEGDQPIRAEVFGIERLEQHAHTLAQAQGITEKPTKGRKLLPRVRDNWRALPASYRDIVATVRDKREITQAELNIGIEGRGYVGTGHFSDSRRATALAVRPPRARLAAVLRRDYHPAPQRAISSVG